LVGVVLLNPLPTSAQLSGSVSVTPPPVASSTDVQSATQSTTQTVAPVVTPPADTTPPVISGAAEASLGLTEATIVWSTDELAISRLEYGITKSYGSEVTLDASALLIHTATILGLTPGKTYYYCIHATDLSGNTSNSCGHSFTTTANLIAVDTNPPTVSLVTVGPVTTSSATINWTTDEIANAKVEYGKTAEYGSNSELDTNLALTHSINLSPLSPDTLYHYRIKSSDELGNVAVTPDETFMTNALLVQMPTVTVTAPEATSTATTTTAGTTTSVSASSVVSSGIEAASIGSSTVTINWTTDFPSDSQVEYSDSSLLGLTTPLNTSLITSHSVIIANLAPNTNYIFRVKSKPLGASAATVSLNHEFNTLAEAVLTSNPANVSSVQASSVSTTTATISWNTDLNTNAQVQYGLATAYDEESALDSSFQKSHSIVLSNLTPNTIYHYRVKSLNNVGCTTFSIDYTFSTASASTTSTSSSITSSTTSLTAPASINNLTIQGHDQTSATLSWSVSSANADTAAEYDIRYSAQPITASNFVGASQDQTTFILYGDLQPKGAERTYVIAGLNPQTKYYFAVKSKYESSDWSELSNVPSITTLAGESSGGVKSGPSTSEAGAISAAGGAPSGGNAGGGGGGSSINSSGRVDSPTVTSAAGEDSEIVLNWKNPNETSFVRAMVVKKAGEYPTSPQDGQVIYEGRSETFTDTNLTNGATYYYALYSYDQAKNYSTPIHVSLAPKKGVYEEKLDATPVVVSKTTHNHFVEILRPGASDIEVEHLQQVLAADEVLYPEKLITGYFGDLTEKALKRFQEKHNLSQTGITDEATQKKLTMISGSQVVLQLPEDVQLFGHDLSYGQSGAEVEDLQQFLIYEGSYAESLVTGYFGDYTRNAVITFQKKYGVKPSVGYVGVKTRHQMRVLTGL